MLISNYQASNFHNNLKSFHQKAILQAIKSIKSNIKTFINL